MKLADLVARVYGAFDVPAAMADVAALCEHDRYQAGAGIDAAAAYVAERAAAAGLAGVEVLRFPADGTRRWWTFAAPVRWTPLQASVHIDGVPVVRYPEQPYTLAANSAPTAVTAARQRGVNGPFARTYWCDGSFTTGAGDGVPEAVRLPVVRWSGDDRPDPAGALVVLEGAPLPAVLGELVERRAAGVVTDPLAARAAAGATPSGGGRWQGQVGRIELPVGCPLFAFSVTGEQLAVLRRATSAGVLVEVESGEGTLPVVTGRLPGADDGGELLLSAHLCHPRPSANDNASGVAALLGIARVGTTLGGAGTAVRFVWGPEFVGMAAYLHDVVHAGRAARPIAAVNVDMAGEDQRRCGGPLIIERAPDELPSPVSAVAERCAALVPAAARSYSGAAPCDTWAWRATPYVGASDHAMLAGRPTGCPAISLGHWPDAANHTSADTLSLVDGEELRRTATIAGSTILALRTPSYVDLWRSTDALDPGIRRLMATGAPGGAATGDGELAADLADATVAWAAAHVLSALPGARPQPPPPVAQALDPWAPEHAARLLAHRAAVAARAVPPHATEWISRLAEHAAGALAVPDPPEPARDAGDSDVLSPCWEGPVNLRHLAECAPPDDRRWLAEITAQDRGGSYARLLALARGLDGRRDGRAVAWWAALTTELAIPVPMARRFLELLCRTGWARSTSEGERC